MEEEDYISHAFSENVEVIAESSLSSESLLPILELVAQHLDELSHDEDG